MAGRFKYTANQVLKNNLPKGLELDTDELSEQLSMLIEQGVQDWERAGRAAMKDIRCTAMSTWNSKKNGRYIAYRESIKFGKSYVNQDGSGNIELTINSYIDSDVFNHIFAVESTGAYDNIERWRTKEHDEDGWTWEDRIEMPWSIGEYVLFNMWDLGFTGLPERAHFTGTGWVNPHFNPNGLGTLGFYTEKQFQKQWKKKVNELYGKV